jgi:stage II sporulation protein D
MLSAWLSEVYGLVIKSNGEIITPYFHKLSAGATRTGPFSYLICADTSRDLENSDFLSVTELTYSQFCETILQKYPDCGISEEHPQDFIQIISRDDAGYVTKILIGSITISGEEFADLFDLSSPSFTITYPQNALKIVTKGIGHGYGISLNYASYLAANQNTYDTIISYFYDNIEITNE